MLRTRMLAATLGVLLLAAAPTAAVATTVETTWALETASAEGPDGRVSFRHVLDPGAGIDEHVAVTNFGTAPATFSVYAGDGVVTAEGNFDLLPSYEQPVAGGSWVRLGDVAGSTPRAGGGLVVEVPAASTLVVPVRVQVPADATPGDYPAGIVAELGSGSDDGVQLASRVGVRLHLRVAGDLVAQVVPGSVAASFAPSWNPFAPGTVTVSYAVVNEGNVRLGATTAASVAGLFGVASSSASAEDREILPGQQATRTVEFAAWPLFFGWGEVTSSPLVVGEDVVDVALATGSTDFSVWTIPWAQLALLALIAAGIVLVVRARRRAEARVQARIDAAVSAATVDADTDRPMASPAN